MLSKAQEKLIKSLHTKKGREKHDKCLVEGEHAIELADYLIEFEFARDYTENFNELITTSSPQEKAAVARIPHWDEDRIMKKDIIVFADGLQDPGNAGAILRLCLAFNASLVLLNSVDLSNPKVIRSSAGAFFQVPWMTVKKDDIADFIKKSGRRIYRLEKTENSKPLPSTMDIPLILIIGNEGNGIQLEIGGDSIHIPHNEDLESLNVGHALAISLYHIRHK